MKTQEDIEEMKREFIKFLDKEIEYIRIKIERYAHHNPLKEKQIKERLKK